MADDINIKIGGDASGMEAASRKGKAATDTLASAGKGLQDAFSRIHKAIDPTYAALERYNKLQADNAALLKSGAVSASEWANTQVRLREEYDRAVASIQAKMAASNADIEAEKRAAQAAREKARAAKDAAKAALDAARADRVASQAADELRSSIDPVFAAQHRYNQVMEQATVLLNRGKISQAEWIAIQKQAKAQMDLNVRSMGRMNSMYVQLGYQAQDVTASLASGINPLVILAQQGGQTAAALSTMGGTVGRVAAFFAGPWGAALLGATLLLGFLLQKTDETKKKTLDLKNAQDLAKMSLEQLTKALKDYNTELVEANRNELEAAQYKERTAQAALTKAANTHRETLATIRNTQAQLRDQMARIGNSKAGTEAAAGQMAALQSQLDTLEESAKRSEEAMNLANAAIIESRIPQVMMQAEAATDGARKAQVDFYRQQTKLYDLYRTEMKAAGDDQNKRLAAEKKLQEGLVEAIKARTKAEKAWRDANRENNNPENRGDEQALYGHPLRGAGTTVAGGQYGAARGYGTHRAIDYAAPAGTPVYSSQAGRVEVAKWSNELGYYVVLDHGGGIKTKYGHLQGQAMVSEGQFIEKDTQIGKVGNTGSASRGNHLHYAMYKGGTPIDPASQGGVHNIDSTEASIAAEEQLQRVQEEALQDYIAGIELKKQLAQDDAQTVLMYQDQKIKAIEEFYGKESREAQNAQRERVTIEQAAQKQILKQKRDALDHALELKERELEADRDIAQQKLDMERETVDFNESNGLISPEEALQQRAAILDQEYAQQLDHENRMFQLKVQHIRDILALENLPAEEKLRLNQQIELAEMDHNQRMKRMAMQRARDLNKINLQSYQIQLNKWRDMWDGIFQSVNQGLQGMIRGTQTWQQFMLSVADSILTKFIDMGVKMLQDWVMKQLGMTAASTAADTAQTASKATNTAAQTAIGAGGAMAELTQRAATAAAGAYSSTVVIPFIGPVAAPAAAALALAAVLGFGALIASAKGGQGRVPYDGQITELHKDEMVLPASIANPLRESLRFNPRQANFARMAAAMNDNRRASANDASMRGGDHISIHAMDAKSFRKFAKRNRRDLGKAAKALARDGFRGTVK